MYSNVACEEILWDSRDQNTTESSSSLERTTTVIAGKLRGGRERRAGNLASCDLENENSGQFVGRF